MCIRDRDHTKQPDNRTTMELGAVLPMTAEVRDDHLFVGGVDMVELAREQGTALYVMDEADLRGRMETYLHAFRSRYAVSYTHLGLLREGRRHHVGVACERDAHGINRIAREGFQRRCNLVLQLRAQLTQLLSLIHI